MKFVLALNTNQELWWLALIVGLVVFLVVWGLLEVLRRAVVEINRAVSDVWTMGKRVAQNTQTAHVLETTSARAADLVDELGHHRAPAGRS